MSDRAAVSFDQGLLEETAANLDLRKPNADALRAIAAALDGAGGEATEVVIEIATAVGKTWVAAGLIDYCAAAGVRNFAIVAPTRSILRKTKANFTPGNRKEVRGRTTKPMLITSEDFDSGAVKAALGDAEVVKLFVFTVQQLIRPSEKASRRVREFQEQLGEGLYDYLKGVDDLIVIADEHHAYFGPKFSDAIRDLGAMALIGLTATVDPKTPKSQVIYRYPLGRAIADGLVKTPVLVGRKDDRTDIETQLRDGVALLNVKRAAMESYCAREGAERINPVMFIVCQSIADADEVTEILKRPEFFGDDYDEAVLTVHSGADDEVLDRLALVEEPENPVRAIVSVSMLKEGWDVKNIYVICALRALASQVLTEQTLGRGLRLPFGVRTDVEMLDTVEVLAHDRYEQLLARADALIRSLIDDRTGAADPTTGVAPALPGDLASSAELAPGIASVPVAEDGTAAASTVIPGVTGTVIRVADTDARREALTREAAAVSQDIKVPPGTDPFNVPVVDTVPVPKSFSLSSLDEAEFERLGRTLAAEPEDVLRRNRLDVVKTAKGFEIHLMPATDIVQASMPEFDLADGEKALVAAILNLGLVKERPAEKNAAERLVGAFVRGMGDGADKRLGAFFNIAVETIRQAVLKSYARLPTTSEVTVTERELTIARTNTRPVTPNRYEIVDRSHPVAYEGWRRSVVALEWFDSDPERQMAVLLDESEVIRRWVRLHRSDRVVINYQSGRYYPDFAAEAVDGVFWLIEVKADNELDDVDVVAKRAAAEEWARYASDALKPRRWRYLLVSETDLNRAKVNWGLLLAQAGAR